MHASAFSHQFLFPVSAMSNTPALQASVTLDKSLGRVGQHDSLSLVVLARLLFWTPSAQQQYV